MNSWETDTKGCTVRKCIFHVNLLQWCFSCSRRDWRKSDDNCWRHLCPAENTATCARTHATQVFTFQFHWTTGDCIMAGVPTTAPWKQQGGAPHRTPAYPGAPRHHTHRCLSIYNSCGWSDCNVDSLSPSPHPEQHVRCTQHLLHGSPDALHFFSSSFSFHFNSNEKQNSLDFQRRREGTCYFLSVLLKPRGLFVTQFLKKHNTTQRLQDFLQNFGPDRQQDDGRILRKYSWSTTFFRSTVRKSQGIFSRYFWTVSSPLFWSYPFGFFVLSEANSTSQKRTSNCSVHGSAIVAGNGNHFALSLAFRRNSLLSRSLWMFSWLFCHWNHPQREPVVGTAVWHCVNSETIAESLCGNKHECFLGVSKDVQRNVHGCVFVMSEKVRCWSSYKARTIKSVSISRHRPLHSC